jgi:hypothetical protein
MIYASRRAGAGGNDFFAWQFPTAVAEQPLYGQRGPVLVRRSSSGLARRTTGARFAAPSAARAYLEDFESCYSSSPLAVHTGVTVATSGGVLRPPALLCAPPPLMVFNGVKVAQVGCSPTPGSSGSSADPAARPDRATPVISPAGRACPRWAMIIGVLRAQALGRETQAGDRHRPVLAFVVAGLIRGFVCRSGGPPACASPSACSWSGVRRRIVVRGGPPPGGVTGGIGELDRGWDKLAEPRTLVVLDDSAETIRRVWRPVPSHWYVSASSPQAGGRASTTVTPAAGGDVRRPGVETLTAQPAVDLPVTSPAPGRRRRVRARPTTVLADGAARDRPLLDRGHHQVGQQPA